MKLKYKKIILLITMSTMAIGMVTLSIGSSSKKNPSNIQSNMDKEGSAETLAQGKPESDTNDIKGNTELADKSLASQTGVTSPSNDTDTGVKPSDEIKDLIDTETAVLKRDAYPKVNELIKKYLDARVACDLDAIKKLVSNGSEITLESLQESSRYIEEYRSIECYTVEAPKEGTYVVYVYEEIKLKGVDTLAPGMGLFYVCTDDDGNPYIYFGEVEDETKKFIDDTREMAEVKKLVETVNRKLDQAKTDDEDLGEFQQNIEKQATNTEKE